MRKQRPKYMEYPEPQAKRIGCKVGWYYYKDEADAKKASKAARYNAQIQLAYGYDFGYCDPGSIYRDQNFYPGLIEVCIP